MKKAVFLSTLLIFLLPITQAQNLATEEVTRTFNEILPSLPKTITENVLSPTGTTVYEIRIDTNTKVTQARIYLNKMSTNNIEPAPGGIVYYYFNLTAKNLKSSQLDELSFKFKVPVDWIEKNGVSKDSVKVLAYSGSGWDEVATEIVGEDNKTVYYRAVPNNFGIFAITGELPVTSLPETDKEQAQNANQEVLEVSPEKNPVNEKIEEGMNWVLVAAGIVVLVAALFLIPGSVLRMNRSVWKAPSR
jgi:PGF-pre-PGF domain-containing protein